MKFKILLIFIALTLIAAGLGGYFIQPAASKGLPHANQQDPSQISPADTQVTTKIYLPMTVQRHPATTVFGIELGSLETSGGLEPMASAGATWIRQNGLLWADVEPNQGQRLWDPALETELKNAAEKGLKTILVVRKTPSWARMDSDHTCGPIQFSQLGAFADFMKDAVARYSQAPYYVKYWEIWNEPDVPANGQDAPYGCWGNPDDSNYGGGYYGQMLKVVYPQIKSADPSAQVLIGGLLLDCNPYIPGACTNTRPAFFLRGILEAGAGNSFDGISFHAYDYNLGNNQYGNKNWNSYSNTTGPVILAKAQYIRDMLNTYGVSGKFLMNTETALIISNNGDCDAACQQAKAYYVAQTYAAAIAANMRANIWFTAMGWRGSALLTGNYTARPAYTAYKFARSILSDAVFVKTIDTYPGVKIYELKNSTKPIWVAWSLDGQNHAIALPQVPKAVWSVIGEPLSISTTNLDISVAPVYIKW